MEFFDTLYSGKPEESFVTLFTLPSATTHFCATPAEAQALAERLGQSQNVYYGCGVASQDWGPKKRGTAEQIAGIPGFWCEFDCAGEGHAKARLPKTRDDILRMLQLFEFAPTLTWSSGNGVQCM